MPNLSLNQNNSKSGELAQQLLEIIPRTMKEIRSCTLSRTGEKIPLPQFRVLANVWRQSKTNKELAEDIGLSISAMSRVISSLESNGWVKKISNSDDRRYADIFITEKGLEFFNGIWTYTCGVMSQQINALSEKEKKDLQSGLKIIEKMMFDV